VLGSGLLVVVVVRPRVASSFAAQLVLGLAGVALVLVPVAPLVISAPFGSQVASTFAPAVVRAASGLLIGSAAGLAFALLMPFVGGEPGNGGRRRARRPPLVARGRRRPAATPTSTTSVGRLDRSAAAPPHWSAVPERADHDRDHDHDELDDAARRAAAGDRGALEVFVRRTQPDVWRLCRYLVDAQSADDLTAEVYEHALRALPSFEGRAPARAWLLTIARRRCADEIRRRGRARRAYDRLGPSPTSIASRDGEVDVHDALDRLDDERRSAFVLTQLLGLSYQEAAEVIGCPIGTVRSRVARARADLVDAMGAGVDGARGGRRADVGPDGGVSEGRAQR
jgi:RNA polymerase sigma-70 factor (ECF subfamily)